MTSYVKVTDFASKDALLSGNPAKLVKGVEIDDEFNALQIADADNVKLTETQTLTNKTLTTPVLTNPSYSGATANGGTVTTIDINGGTIDGTVIGGATPAAATVTSLTDSGNLTFTGTGNRITGDFSNATEASRVAIQTSTTNGKTLVPLYPNGTGTEVGLSAPSTPMTFYTGGAERMRIDTVGQITGGNSAGSTALALTTAAAGVNARIKLTTTSDTSSVAYVLANSHASINKQASMYLVGANGGLQFQTGQTAGAEPTTGTGAFRIQDNFVGVIVPTVGLGYDTGAGGTVTQATSRTTGVTLNKPTGAITMFTAAGSATWSTFVVNNSLIAATDTVVLSVKAGASNVYNMVPFDIQIGAFSVAFASVSGTASDAPVINFAIIKGATS